MKGQKLGALLLKVILGLIHITCMLPTIFLFHDRTIFAGFIESVELEGELLVGVEDPDNAAPLPLPVLLRPPSTLLRLFRRELLGLSPSSLSLSLLPWLPVNDPPLLLLLSVRGRFISLEEETYYSIIVRLSNGNNRKSDWYWSEKNCSIIVSLEKNGILRFSIIPTE